MIGFVGLSLIFSSIASAGLFGTKLCKTDGFHCIKIKGGQSWRSLWPDDHDRDIVMRINRMNTQLYPGLKIAVPDNLEQSDIMNFAPFTAQIQTTGEKLIIVDPKLDAWGAYDAAGTLVRWGPASAGSDWCRDIDEVCHTRTGHFRVFQLGSSSCYSTKFPLPDGGAPMPYCMYFNGGQALHGSYDVAYGNRSHGCVRIHVSDAKWLRYHFVEGPRAMNHYQGTKVIIRPY